MDPTPARANAFVVMCLLAPTAVAKPSSPRSDERPLDAQPSSRVDVSAPSRASEPGVPVLFMGEYQESTQVSLYPDPEPKGPVPPLMQCETPCGGRVKRARYRLRIPDNAESVGGVPRIGEC